MVELRPACLCCALLLTSCGGHGGTGPGAGVAPPVPRSEPRMSAAPSAPVAPRWDLEPTVRLLLGEDPAGEVVALPLETYLRGVVTAEVPDGWHLEAHKAQAIAARSYALAHLGGHDRPYDLMSTTLDQVYRPRESPTAVVAVDATRGQVLVADGVVVEAFYHSTCGGHTEDPVDVWPDAPVWRWATTCDTCARSPRYRWQVRLPTTRVAAVHPEVGHLDALELTERAPSGRALSIALVEEGRSVTMPANEFRRAVGTSTLPSAFFEVERRGATMTFRGRGFGHGVGMCQWGAQGLADGGQDHVEVLGHYYRGTTVRRAYD